MHLLEQVTPHAPFLAQIHSYNDTDHIYQKSTERQNQFGKSKQSMLENSAPTFKVHQ